jgi:hypothetical protein
MPDLIPAKDGIFDRHPECIEITGFPFDVAQGGESFDVAQDRESFDVAQDRESFDVAQDRESFDVAQDREPVERPVEPRVKPGMTKN